MTTLIVWLLSCFGLYMIIGHGRIFGVLKARFLDSFFVELLGCAMCFGFWTGVASSAFFYSPLEELVKNDWFRHAATGFVVAGSNLILYTWISLPGALMNFVGGPALLHVGIPGPSETPESSAGAIWGRKIPPPPLTEEEVETDGE